MIAGIFHQGSGLGNQLARYVFTRCLALDKGFEFGMVNPHLFKGAGFLNIDMGKTAEGLIHLYEEKRVNNENGVDIRGYDFEGILNIKDNTRVDGELQGEKYYEHHKDEIREWLNVEPFDFPIPFAEPENVCVLAFRGGEYVGVPDLFLPKEYWYNAMENMRKFNPKIKFGVVTDDIATAQEFFPNFPIRHEIGEDWRSIRSAHNLILSNSSFGILPAWLGNAKHIISPWGWARYNLGFWAMQQNKIKGWHYQRKDGSLELLYG